jgi:hypothetical protein
MPTFLTRQQMLVSALGKGAIEKRAHWEGRAERYFGRSTTVKSWVMPDPTLQARMLERANRVAPLLARSIERHLVPVALMAQRDWPVKTGLSRSLLTFELIDRGADKFAARLANPIAYANLIDGGSVADELVFRPAHVAAERVAADMAKGV